MTDTDLLASPLPAASWIIYGSSPQDLFGQLLPDDRMGLEKWAAAHRVPVNWDHYDGVRPEVRFTVAGVSVRVWSRMNDRAKSAAEGYLTKGAPR